MTSLSTRAVGRSDYLAQLAVIREDPQVKSLAHRRAGDPELAEDALQETYYATARVGAPERIEDVRAYFCGVLIRKINSLRSQLSKVVVVDDVAGLADAFPRRPGGEALPPLLDELVNRSLLAGRWLDRLASRRAALAREVPARSSDPDRYRDLIVTAAERMLLALMAGDFRKSDLNQAMRSAYPEWFAAEGVAASNVDQRSARARADARELLKIVISRDELDA